MTIVVRSLTIIALTAALVACNSKPAAPGASPAGAAAGTSVTAGNYHGVPIYPGMTELYVHDTIAGKDGTLHAGNYRSDDKPEQVLAYYREQLGKLYAGTVREDSLGEGMHRIVAGANEKAVTVLVHTGDSGESVVGIQVISKD